MRPQDHKTTDAEELLRQRIQGGHYTNGVLPSERVLSRELGIARTTLRLILTRLAAENIIESHHGIGWKTTNTDLPNDWWTAEDCARYLGIERGTWTGYVSRGQAPDTDHKIGRSKVWPPAVIKEWDANRPRVGQAEQSPMENTLTVDDIILRSLSAEQMRVGFQTPLALNPGNIVPTSLSVSDDSRRHAVEIAYNLEVRDFSEILIWKAKITYVAIVEFDNPVERENLDPHVQGILTLLEPHLRELVHSLTARAGLPPLVIDLGRRPT